MQTGKDSCRESNSVILPQPDHCACRKLHRIVWRRGSSSLRTMIGWSALFVRFVAAPFSGEPRILTSGVRAATKGARTRSSFRRRSAVVVPDASSALRPSQDRFDRRPHHAQAVTVDRPRLLMKSTEAQDPGHDRSGGGILAATPNSISFDRSPNSLCFLAQRWGGSIPLSRGHCRNANGLIFVDKIDLLAGRALSVLFGVVGHIVAVQKAGFLRKARSYAASGRLRVCRTIVSVSSVAPCATLLAIPLVCSAIISDC